MSPSSTSRPWENALGNARACALLTLACLGVKLAQAADVTWTNTALNNAWNTTTNWSGTSSPSFLPAVGDRAYIDKSGSNKAVYSSGNSPNLNDLYVGSGSGKTGLLEITGGTLTATNNASRNSYIGTSGGNGAVVHSDGAASINALLVGNGSGSQGSYSISGGSLVVARGGSNGSIDLGNGSGAGQGTFVISGGSLKTRSGVTLGNGGGTGVFNVAGSGAAFIDIGSSSSIDGFWNQSASSTLKIGIDLVGVTPIFIDYVDGTGGGMGDVTFANGAKLDVGFLGGSDRDGTWDIMKWEGTLTNNGSGLQFAPTVNQSIWSMAWVDTDGLNGADTLRVTATGLGTPTGRTSVTVSSISQLRQFSAVDNCDVTMTPGVYQMYGPATRPAANLDDSTFINLRGLDSTYTFTGVTINVDTQELPGYGSTYGPIMLAVANDGIVVDGLTLTMQKTAYNGVDAYGNPKEFTANTGTQIVRLTGSNTTVRNCNITTGGSYPYGYGDAFGKGARPNIDGVTSAAFISHTKQSGFLITNGASNVTVENTTLNMRSYGHGFFMQQGASDITFTDCQVIGDTMADSDDIIAHPVYQQWQAATYNFPIPADINISKHEDAFRVYGNSDYQTNGYPELIHNITLDNCRVERMRSGVACADADGFLRVYDTELVGCEHGFAPSGYGTESTFVRCKGDALNGPIIYFQRSVNHPADMEVELTGSAPGKGVWPVALISGSGSNITLTSSASPGVYPAGAYVCLSQKWREWRHRPSGNLDELGNGSYAEATTNTTVNNQTGQALFLGPNATGNPNLTSAGDIINKSSGNGYTGTTLVPPNLTLMDTWTSPTNPLDVPWAQFNSGGTQILPTAPYQVFSGLHLVDHLEDVGGTYGTESSIAVQAGGTLEIGGGIALQGGAVTVAGSGTTGQGAIYSAGTSSNTTRLNSSSGTIVLSGDTTIGVGTSGNQFLVGPISGAGNLTKTGPGKLVMERSSDNSFSGSLTIAQGEINARTGKAKNDLSIAAGAIFSQNGSLALNQAPNEFTTLDGTLDINGRSAADTGAYSVNIGTLTGSGAGVVTSTSTAAVQTLNATSSTADGTYAGKLQGRVSLVKSGTSRLTLTGTNHTHTEPTVINGGTLVVNGSLPSTSPVNVNSGGTLGGTGTVQGTITLNSGSTLSPGTSVGILTTAAQTWNGGASLAVDMTNPAGAAGAGWDLVTLSGTLTLDASVSSVTPMLIKLAGPAMSFVNSQNQSWLIASTTGISGSFDTNKFSVDATSFAANNPLGGGQFSVTNTGGDLYLDFTAVTYTALESWRIANFGTASNTGTAANLYDADFDGIPNLLEYATNSNPKASESTPVLVIGKSLDGTKLSVTFNRVADPQLSYFVEAKNDDLGTDSWIPVWSSTGASNTAGPVTVDDTVTISSQPKRFLRLRVSY